MRTPRCGAPAHGVNRLPRRVSRTTSPRYTSESANDHENEYSPASVDLMLAPKIEKLSMNTNIDPVSAPSAATGRDKARSRRNA